MPRGMKRTATNRSRAYLFKQRATFEGAKRRASVCESLSSMRGAQSNIHNVREFLLYSFERTCLSIRYPVMMPGWIHLFPYRTQ